MLRKADRLASRDIDRLSQGKSVFGTLISLRYSPAERAKFSVSVSKKVAAKATDRNRLRRRVYAAVREARQSLKKPVFAMLMPKKECLSCKLSVIRNELSSLFNKAGLS
jgi:ribonuclease P protein component